MCCLESDVREGTECHQRCYSAALPISSICSSASVYCHRSCCFSAVRLLWAKSCHFRVLQEIIVSRVLLNWMVFILTVSHRDCLVFFSPFSPFCRSCGTRRSTGCQAVIPVSHQRPNFNRLFPGRAHVHRLNSWPKGRVYCSLKQFIAIGCTAVCCFLYTTSIITNSRQKVTARVTHPCVCVFWQIKRVIHYILTVEMFWGCLFSTENYLEGNF